MATTTPGGLKGLSEDRRDLYTMPFDAIEMIPGWNVRTELEGVETIEDAEKIQDSELREHILWLVQNIGEVGIKEPVKGYYDKVTKTAKATNGHCRLTAVRILRNSFGKNDILIPFLPEERGSNEGDRIASMLISNSGLPLTALQKAKVIRKLANYGWDNAQIGRTCKPPLTAPQVENLLELSSATPTTEELIKSGLIKPTTAIGEIKAVGADAAEVVLQKTIELAEETGSKPTGELAKEVRTNMLATGELTNSSKKPPTSRSARKPSTAKEQQRKLLQLALLKGCMQNAKVNIADDGKVTASIEFNSMEDWELVQMAVKSSESAPETDQQNQEETPEETEF